MEAVATRAAAAGETPAATEPACILGTERAVLASAPPDKYVAVLNAIANGERLTSVDLTTCGLKSVPVELYDLSSCLEILNLGNNEISCLPEDFHVFTKLRILFCGQNKFETVPSVLGKMKSLYMVSFKSNRVNFIPPESLCPSIGWLILTDNSIPYLPSTIGSLSKLQKLMLAGNQLTSLPWELSNCKELQLVRLSYNRLTELPLWLVSLPQLSWLAYSGNPCCRPEHNVQGPLLLALMIT
jgi:Leucine-rich repeat (LRR) protein